MSIESKDKEIEIWSPSQTGGDAVVSIPDAAGGEKVLPDTPQTTSRENGQEGIDKVLSDKSGCTLKLGQNHGFLDGPESESIGRRVNQLKNPIVGHVCLSTLP